MGTKNELIEVNKKHINKTNKLLISFDGNNKNKDIILEELNKLKEPIIARLKEKVKAINKLRKFCFFSFLVDLYRLNLIKF